MELKAAKGRPSELQIHELHKIRDSGGLAILLYPDDLTTFQNLIHAIKENRPLVVAACMEIFEERIKKYE